MTPPRRPRWRRRLVIVAAVITAALLGLRFFIRSGPAARLAAGQLGGILQTTVTIDTLRAALVGDTSVHGLKLYNDDIPYLEADHVTLDVSVASAVGGRRLPQLIDMSGVRMRLHFDSTGKLLTKLPTLPQSGRLPSLRLRDMELTLSQDGRPPLTLRRASGTLTPSAEDNLAGEIDDPELGRFGVTGRFGQGKLHLRVTHPGLAISPERCRTLPFLPRALTRRLEADGVVPVDLSLWLGRVRPRCRYRVAFGPTLVRLLQGDRPPFAASGVEGVVAGDDMGAMEFKGDIRDPRWGDWSIAATQANDVLDLRLCTSGAAVDPERLAELPFVPRGVWRHVQGTGRTPARVHVRIPKDQPGVHYRVELTPRLTWLRVGKLDLDAADATGHVVIDDNVVRLGGWAARVADGDLALGGEMDFHAATPRLRFDLDARKLHVKSMPAAWGLPGEIDGRLSGVVNLSLSLEDHGVVTRGDGAARLEGVSIAGVRVPEPVRLSLRGADLDVGLKLPRIELGDVDRRLAGVATAAARLTVPIDLAADRAAWRGTARMSAGAIEVGEHCLRDVAVNALLDGGRLRVIDARADALGGVVTGDLDLELTTLRGAGSLLVRGPDLGRWPGVERVRASVSLGRDRLELKDVTAATRGGEVTGWAQLAFDDGAVRGELHTTRLDLARATRTPVEGEVSGHASGVYRPGEGVAFQADVASPRVVVKGVAATNLRGRLDFADGRATYQLTGEALGGGLSVQGRHPPTAGEPAGVVKLERARLARLWEALGLTGRLGGLGGVAAVNLPYYLDGATPAARGRFEVRDLRWHGGELTDVFSGDFHLGPDGVTLRDAGGILAGGSLRLSGGYRFGDASRGWFDARLTGAELSRLPLEGDFKDLLQGPIDLALRGNLGAELRGSGAATLTRGKIFGVEVTDWRLPVEFAFAPSAGQAEISIRESGARLGNGRAQLRVGLRYAGGWRAEGQLVFFDAGLRSLSGLLGEAATLARGRVNGRVDFAAAELRSLADLTATVHAKLHDAQALQMPVLRLLVPHLLPSQGALEFKEGEMRGTLSNGVFRIGELTLDSSLLLLLLQGSVTLQGRLDLDVMAQTSSTGVDPLLLRSIFRRVPLIGPVPVALITRITELLSDRVVHLRVGGTLRSPRVWVEPLRLLSDQAAHFFLSRAVDAAIP